MALCKEGCGRVARSRGWCSSHYRRWRAGQPLDTPIRGYQRYEEGPGGKAVHDLRHFYASGLIAAGCDVVTVQRAMGHKSATVTLNTYSHRWPKAEDRTRKAAAGMFGDAMSSTAGRLRTDNG